MHKEKLTIIGCGLIGGSVALAFKRRRPGWTVVCLDRPERLPAVREAGVADEVGTAEDYAAHLPESSIVLLAMPVQAILTEMERISRYLRPGTIVTDTGSTKARIMARAQECLPSGAHFIGGHPMAGSELSGVEAAEPLLFSDRVYALCPFPGTPPEALLTMIGLVEDLLALPVTVEPEEHDQVVAVISHLPQLLAMALMHTALEQDATHGMLDMIAGRGFLDLTRIAVSEFEMWRGILETNREAIGEALDRFEESLSLLRAGMAAGDAMLLWERVSRRRRRMGLETRGRMRKPDLRGLIDRYDKQLLSALGNRMQAARRIGRLKLRQGAPVRDPERERRLMDQRREWGNALALPPQLVEELFAVILRHSAGIQGVGPG